jgi:hypothetical protein
VAFSPTTSAALRYWNLAWQRYCRRLARYRNTWRVSAYPVAKPAGHTRAESRDCRPTKVDAGERLTLCWREMDSNPRSPAYDEFGAPGRAHATRAAIEKPRKPIVRVGERFAARLGRLSHGQKSAGGRHHQGEIRDRPDQQARHPDNQIIGRAKKITWNRPSVRAGLGRAATPPHRGPPLPRTRAPRSARKLARRQA